MVTAIVKVRNETDFEAIVSNLERPIDTDDGRGAWCRVRRESWRCGFPWCQEELSFSRHSLGVAIGPADFAVWSAWFEDGDFIRSDGGAVSAWSSPGPHIAGLANTNGDRVLVIRLPEGLSLEQYNRPIEPRPTAGRELVLLTQVVRVQQVTGLFVGPMGPPIVTGSSRTR